MDQAQFDRQVHVLSVVAAEAVEESDAVARHPDVIDALNAIAEYDQLNDRYFNGNGHDPNGLASSLAEALEPYKRAPLEDPKLVHGINFLAWALQDQRSDEELREIDSLR